VAALEIAGLRKKFGGVVALDGVDIAIGDDGITGVIGPNGSGKTTLFNVVTGVHKPTAGRVLWRGEDITGQPAWRIARQGLVRTFQQAMSYPGLSVRDNVRIGNEHGRDLPIGEKRWSDPEDILRFVGLEGRESEIAGSLSFGNLRRLGIAVALATEPRMLLLDEPAAGLSDGEAAELRDLILRFPGMGIGVCLIDHDMALMGAVCTRFVVLNFGTKIAEGPPEVVLKDPKVLEVYLGGEV
jgi:branched-chain amino acid transport system ATP-binding protein